MINAREKLVLDNLVAAWNVFTSLDKGTNADDREFCDAIHRCQQIIALRIARRVNPDIFRNVSSELTIF